MPWTKKLDQDAILVQAVFIPWSSLPIRRCLANWDRLMTASWLIERSRSSSFLPDHCFEVVPVVVGDFGGKLLDLLRRDEPHAIGYFLKTGNFQPLA